MSHRNHINFATLVLHVSMSRVSVVYTTPSTPPVSHLLGPQEPHAAAGQFGFPVDNTLGGTPQLNSWSSDWVAFLRDRRLGPQLVMAGKEERG